MKSSKPNPLICGANLDNLQTQYIAVGESQTISTCYSVVVRLLVKRESSAVLPELSLADDVFRTPDRASSTRGS